MYDNLFVCFVECCMTDFAFVCVCLIFVCFLVYVCCVLFDYFRLCGIVCLCVLECFFLCISYCVLIYLCLDKFCLIVVELRRDDDRGLVV